MRRRSQRMDTVIILYFGTSARSLSYVDCESRGKNTSGQYSRSSHVYAFASPHTQRETRRPLIRLPPLVPLDEPFRACTEPDRVLDGSPDAPCDEIHAPVRRELGCWPSPSSSPWTISARTGKITRRRRRPSVTELIHSSIHPSARDPPRLPLSRRVRIHPSPPPIERTRVHEFILIFRPRVVLTSSSRRRPRPIRSENVRPRRR